MWFPFSRFKITGHSMEPFFKSGDKVVINRISYLFFQPQPGDIVALTHRDSILLKQIKKVSSNNKYFVAGINIVDSHDSRNFGKVKREQIVGKFLTKY
ncbi:MAG: S26 family signal peptidase [bacterium]|nr:S26 family signal peptidase [bacterium]